MNTEKDYVTRVFSALTDLPAAAWNALLAEQHAANLFERHEYLSALQDSGAATPPTGWTLRLFTLWADESLHAACAVYIKTHSYGEYVFDWAWADAYARHGLSYYPKAVIAPAFTPVPGARLLAVHALARQALVRRLLDWCAREKLSSLHLLFGSDEDWVACRSAGLMERHTVQFHWHNSTPGYQDFDDFLQHLQQEKRKKIRQERRKVAEAGVRFRSLRGTEISRADWDFFYRCYAQTYREHGNAPYLPPAFFQQVAQTLAGHWLLFIAERDGQAIAASLIALSDDGAHPPQASGRPQIAYGRYWGALERVDCLHFEACYYQPIAWCIAHGVTRFEGGAQGEHKMARALLPVKTTSAHWIAHAEFAQAIDRFLSREGEGVTGYLEALEARSPLRHLDLA